MMRVLQLLLLSGHLALAIFPVNRQLDDSNPEGVPGVDFPTYRAVPRGLSFQCFHRPAGFYADPETQCQIWHLCDLHGRKHSFLCPNRTMFNQLIRGCDWWYNVDCDGSVDLYSNNDDLFRVNRVENNNIAHRRPAPTSRLDENDGWVEAVTQAALGQASSPVPSIRPFPTAAPPRPVPTAPPRPVPTAPPRPVPTAPPRREPPPQQRVTFQVIRRPITQPPPPTEPPFQPSPQFAFNDQPEQHLTSVEVPDEPPTTWQVQFVASNPPPTKRVIRPLPLDNSWRLPQDQERSFPKNPPAPTLPPQHNFIASSTRRTPHIVDTSSPVSVQLFDHQTQKQTRVPPPTVQNLQSSSVRISSPPFGARTTASWSADTQTDFQHSNSVSLHSSPVTFTRGSSFSPSFSPSSAIRVNPSSFSTSQQPSSVPPATQGTPQLVFGRRTSSQAPSASDFDENNFSDQSATASTLTPQRYSSISNREHAPSASTWRNFPTSISLSTPRTTNFQASSSFRARASTPTVTWSSPVDDNRLGETNVDDNADEEESDIFKTEVQTTEFYRTFNENEVTTYHPRNSIPPETSLSYTDPPTTHAPVTRTSRRRVIKTTTPVIIPTTFRPRTTFIDNPTTTTTTSPRPTVVVQGADPEPSVPLVFGARLRPKKVEYTDNAVASSEINQSTLRESEKGSVYYPPIVDNVSEDHN